MNTIPSEQQLQAYLKEKNVEQILTALLEAVCYFRPDNVPKFMAGFLAKHYGSSFGGSEHQHSAHEEGEIGVEESLGKQVQAFSYLSQQQQQQQQQQDNESEGGHDYQENSGDIDLQTSESIRRRYSVSFDRRGGMSNESIDVNDVSNFKRARVPKTPEERKRLEDACSKITLFKYLDEEELNMVYDAMFEKKFNSGEVIIKQGSEGDNFYVVDSGECEIVKEEGGDSDTSVATHLKDAFPGDSFGELALIFGTPRAATVRAKTSVKLWAIDRITYRTILMKETIKKRKMYEDFLKQCSILSNLTPYERDTIADALVAETYAPGSIIVKQGEPGDSFFIIVDGEVSCVKDETHEELVRLKRSDYFGELALLYDQPRACTVKAVTPVKIVKLNRQSFKQLLGPIEQILKRNMEQYNKYMSQKM